MRLPPLCLDKAGDQLFLLDRQGRIVGANQAACQSLGYSRKELLAMRFAYVAPLFTLKDVWAKHWAELEESRSLRFESEHRKKDGTLTPAIVTSRLIELDGQEYLCAIVQNPAEYRGEVGELADSNESFRMLFEHADAGMARFAASGEFLQVNDAFCRLVGYDREEILARNVTIQDLIFPQDLDAVLARQQQLLDGHGPSFSIEARHVHKRGAIVWTKLSISLLRDKRGKPLYFVGTALDITANKQTEEFQKLAAAVFAHTHDGIVVTDLEGRIESVNAAFTALTGYEEAEVLGQNPKLLKSDKHPPGFYAALWSSLKSKGHWRGEIWNRHKNGEIRPRLMTINVINNAAGEPVRYVGVFSDISKLKESEAQLNYLAYHDSLTALANRRMLELRAEHALQTAHRYHQPLALLMIDLDHFKDVNDTLGHAAGDELLKEISIRFGKRLRHTDTLARLGGDEFAVLLEGSADQDTAGRVARDLLAQLDTPVELAGGTQIMANASIGVSLFPEHGKCYADLLQHADVALYRAKSEGRRTFKIFSESMAVDVKKWLGLRESRPNGGCCKAG